MHWEILRSDQVPDHLADQHIALVAGETATSVGGNLTPLHLVRRTLTPPTGVALS